MLSRLRLRKLGCAAVTRIVLAGLLSLALLSGVVPSGTLTSSAEQTCTMSCCVGKPPHAAGSCGAAFSAPEQESEKSADNGALHQHHSDGMQAEGPATETATETVVETVEAPSHCGSATAHLAQNKESSRRAPPKAAPALKAYVLTTPCSPECAAAAASAFSHVRRAPDTAALAENKRPLSHSFASLAEHTARLQKPSAAQGRQARPRAPPFTL